MWLLSTDRAELHFFETLSSVDHKYVVLSHVVGEADQSFEEILKLRKTPDATSIDIPRNRASETVCKGCTFAEGAGYKYIWMSPCCIDTRSNAGLDDAFASLYDIYEGAEECYALLPSDVRGHRLDFDAYQPFGESVWFKCGWTLPALVASRTLIFLSPRWEIMGSKHDHAERIQQITDIRNSVILGEESPQNLRIAIFCNMS